ncbi:MAG: elongation factor G [Armatimonadota bacterium]|nr:elongation factor G [Armatimonadota bacterium]
MQKYAIDAIRNIALAGHSGSGKTSLAESLLHVSGAVDRLGKVDDGSATMDYDPDEVKRKISINTALAPCEWQGRKLNLLDTPGYPDFVGDVIGALRVTESVLISLDAVSGAEVGTETASDIAKDRGIARLFFVNKMDRENADFGRVMESLTEKFGNHVIPIQLPIGSQDSFRGVVDLIKMKAITWSGGKPAEGDIPADLQSQASGYREKLIEAAAEMDDDLITKYLDGESLTDEEVAKGLELGVQGGSIMPVLCGSATKLIGIQTLLDFLADSTPAPAAVAAKGVNPQTKADEERKPDDAFSALVFKTMADPYVGKLTYFRVYSGSMKSDSQVFNSNKGREERIGQVYFLRGKQQEATPEVGAGDIGAVSKLQETSTGDTMCDKAKPIVFPPIELPQPVFSLSIRAKTKADEDKLGPALQRLAEEDPTFKTWREAETGQTLISGMGETQLDISVDRLKRKFGVDVETETPRTPYRETILGKGDAQGRHKKQTGGRGQFGDCWIRIEPTPRGEGLEFVDKVVGGSIPRQYIPAVEKGIRDAMDRGILAGYPVVDIKAEVYDGSFHTVDSSELAFRLAGVIAFENAVQKAQAVLLEPIANIDVIVPEEFMGDVIGDLNAKRGRILGMESVGNGKQRIRATVPESETKRYAIDLRSIARGRGWFKAERSHYEETPAHISQQIIAEAKKAREES